MSRQTRHHASTGVLTWNTNSQCPLSRFDLPQPINSYTGDIIADAYGPACTQQLIPKLPENQKYTGPESEDCKSLYT